MTDYLSADVVLQSAINQVVTGLLDSDNQYMISANYYDHQTPERLGERWYIAQIWFSAESAWNVKLTDEGLVCDVKLNRHDMSQISRILLPYDQIWSIQQLSSSHFADQDVIYHRSDKLNLKRPTDEDLPT